MEPTLELSDAQMDRLADRIAEKLNTERRYLPLRAAAKYCGLSLRTIEQAVIDGKLHVHKPSGKRLVSRDAIAAWVEGRSIEMAKPTP